MHPPTSVARCWSTVVRSGLAAGVVLAALAGAPAHRPGQAGAGARRRHQRLAQLRSRAHVRLLLADHQRRGLRPPRDPDARQLRDRRAVARDRLGAHGGRQADPVRAARRRQVLRRQPADRRGRQVLARPAAQREGPAGGLRLQPRRHRDRRRAHRRPADQGPRRADHDQPRGAGLRDLLQGHDRGATAGSAGPRPRPRTRRPSGSTRTRPAPAPTTWWPGSGTRRSCCRRTRITGRARCRSSAS